MIRPAAELPPPPWYYLWCKYIVKSGTVKSESARAAECDRVPSSLETEVTKSGIPGVESLLKHVPPDHIPDNEDLFTSAELGAYLEDLEDPPMSLIAVGDILLGDHAAETLTDEGLDYPFRAVNPLL